MRWILGFCGCVAWWSGAPGVAHARSEPANGDGYELDYRAPASCPTRDELKARLLDRGILLEEPFARGALVIRVTFAESRYQATLVVREGVDAATERRLEAAECSELSSAIVLIAGLLTEAKRAEATQAPADSPEPDPVGRKTTEQARWLAASRDESPGRDVRKARSPRFGLGAALLARDGVAPGLAYGGLVFTEFRASRSGLFAPSVRLGLGFATGKSDQPEGSARFDWLAARAWFAPFRWPEGPIGVELSALVEGGRLRATATRAENPTERSGAWLAGGLEVAADAELAPFSIVVGVGAVVPLVRDRFYLGPATTVYRSPAVAKEGRLAVVVRFW